MWEYLIQMDVELFRWINQRWTSPWADGFLSLISDFNTMKWVLLPVLVGVAIWGGLRGRLMLGLMLAALVIGDAGINWAIKRTVNRPRPYQGLEDVRRVEWDRQAWGPKITVVSKQPWERGRSMTSGHVCNNVALAFLASLFFAPWGRLVWIWAGLIAYSRVYTADHYPSDVVASFFVATAYTAGICCVAQFLWQHYGSRYFPNAHARHPRLYERLF
ncbi:MAG: phosphatase PAP2 family protein [Blastochloris sp.]|nr:phosphatase PAP2 family protein [Blastochloris sp.]